LINTLVIPCGVVEPPKAETFKEINLAIVY